MSISVLVVDDDEMNRIIVSKMVQREGASVTAVGGGAEALEALKECPRELVLLDMQMPDLDGPDTAVAIRALGDTIEQPRIVILSAFVDESVRQRAREAGVSDILQKPLDRSDLARLVGAADL